MKIVFDLDGVLRDLQGTVIGECCPEVGDPLVWRWKDKDRHDIFWHVGHDLPILTRCRPTKYYRVPMNFPDFEIWTVQPKSWRPHTEKWIRKVYHEQEGYLMPIKVVYFESSKEKIAMLNMQPETWLVEDSPNLPSYERVILIHTAYNKHKDAPVRTCDAVALGMMIAKRFREANPGKKRDG